MNKDTYTAQANTWARPSDRQIEEFFRVPQNFHSGMRIAAVIYAIGPFDSEVDWDRGCWIYEWRKKTIRVRVVTSAAYVTEIELLDPTQASDFDEAVEILWKYPEVTRTT